MGSLVLNYPDPALEYPLFDFTELPDPPARYRLYGETPEEITKSRRFKLEQLDALARFHFWGIKLSLRRATSVRIIRALMKLVYYLDDIHRPRSWEQLCDTTGDAGPRLLSCSVDSTSLIPISRHHPHPPSHDGFTKPGYVRPSYAASSLPDPYVERMILVDHGEPATIEQTNSTPQNSNVPHQNVPHGNVPQNNNVIVLDDDDQRGQAIDVAMGSPVFTFTNTAASGNLIRLPSVQAQAVVEAIERTVLQFAYADLERHPSASHRIPCPYLIATSEEDLLKSIVSSVPAVSKLSLSDTVTSQGVSLSTNGNQFIYRGRGPVWSANSCAVDCTVVVGRLLDAGSTVYDRKQAGWETRLSRAERSFIDATDANWDVLSREESINLRDELWRVLEQTSSAVRVGSFNSVWSVWAAVAANIPQIQFSYVEAHGYCPCRGLPSNTVTYNASFVTPPVYPQDQAGVTMQEVISRPFTPVQLSYCRECGMADTVTHERRICDLPLRMVVTLDERVNIKSHTQDFSIDYCDINGLPQKATYRWLGGVYSRDNHFCVFWTDGKRGEANSGELMVYDGMQNSGLMVGGISPYHPEERVPPMWWRRRSIPLLIYERVMNPEPEVLNCALHSVYGMMNTQLANAPILHQHTPWTPTGNPPAVTARPWNPILPTYGHRFHDIPTAYTPEQNTAQQQTMMEDIIELSPRMEAPQPFTADPMATLNSGSPITLPISLPITQRLNQSNSAFLPSADPDAMLTSPPRHPPHGPFFYIPSPSPPQRSPPADSWVMRMSIQSQAQPRPFHLKRAAEEAEDDDGEEKSPSKKKTKTEGQGEQRYGMI